MYFLQTTDVEMATVNGYSPCREMAQRVLRIGLPRVLDLYARFGVVGTFFFTGKIVELEPRVLDLVLERGHEVGCHGYTHYSNEGFDTMTLERQVEYLDRAKRLIEPIAGRITVFRSPELRIGADTVKALEETGFEVDSSVASQRFDGPLSYGTVTKLKWLRAPRRPYRMSRESPFRSGDSKVLEVPVSAFGAPYIGTLMRVSPAVFTSVEKTLMIEAKRTNKPLVFIFHPTECIEEKLTNQYSIRDGVLTVLRDGFRQRLKQRNLGAAAIGLMERTFTKAVEQGFEFVTVGQYRDIWCRHAADRAA